MGSICLHASAVPDTYEASGTTATGTAYTLVGGYTALEDGSIEYRFTRNYTARLFKIFYVGTLDPENETLSGTCGLDENKHTWSFRYRRLVPEILVAYPPPDAFDSNRIRALWSFTLSAVLNEVRRRFFSWSYIKDRRDRRIEFLELVRRQEDQVATEEELQRLAHLNLVSTCDEAHAFHVFNQTKERPVPVHL